jgi:nucleoside phosphorylase/tetratricopeptide (TPR) repeat protein
LIGAHVNAAVITALPVESAAVLARMSDIEQRQHPQGTIYNVGNLKTAPAISIGHVEIGMGVERTALHVERAVAHLAPDVVLFVGVAGGVKDCDIGDVVVATKTYQYEYGADGATFRPRPQTGAPSHLMEQLARLAAQAFSGQVILGAIATGGKVVHSKQSTTGRLLTEAYSDTIAVDMEGHSLYLAASTISDLHSLVVRGVSDLLDGKASADAGGSQARASAAAADFAATVLERFYELRHGLGPKIGVNRLPTDLANVIGRAQTLRQLTAVWRDPVKTVASLTAWAGTGKTAVARAWSEQVAPLLESGGFLFSWSFYDQGTSSGHTSTDEFFVTLLEFLEVDDPQRLSPWRRVEDALNLCRARSGIVVLDGLEPLQYSDGIELGCITDRPLAAFVDAWASTASLSTLVLTSRVPIAGVGIHHVALELPNLSPTAGADALEFFGLDDARSTLVTLASAVDGHCMSLRLVARFLSVCKPRTPRDHAAAALEALRQPARKIARLLGWYQDYLADTPQCDLLRSVGLFDRPAPFDALYAVHASPVIDHINPLTHDLSVHELELAVDELAMLGLVRVDRFANPPTIDAHPLLRESFGREIERDARDGWMEAHGRLYAHFAASLVGPATSAADLNVLYRAAKHGVLAGKAACVVATLLRDRVQQGNRSFATKILQAANADLVTLTLFFSDDWSTVRVDLNDTDERWLRGHVVYDLRVLGEVQQALRLCEQLFDMTSAVDKPARTVLSANASHLSLLSGDLVTARRLGRQAVDASTPLPPASAERIAAARALGNALLHLGDPRCSDLLEREALSNNAVNTIHPAFLSPVGFRYGTLLIARCEEGLFRGSDHHALGRVESAIARFDEVSHSLSAGAGYDLADGLAYLVLARLCGLQARFGALPAHDPLSVMADAEAHLRAAATQDLIVCCDLYAGRVLCDVGEGSRGLALIREARRTAARFAFPLYEITAQVEEGVALYDDDRPSEALATWGRARAAADDHLFGLELNRISYLKRWAS